MAPPPSSFGIIADENGSEWLGNLEAHFLDQEWDDDNTKKCKYFHLKLTGCAKAQYEKLDEEMKTCWDKLSTKWHELHLSLAVIDTPETTWICLFSSLHLDESKLVSSRTLSNGEESWECIEFVKHLENVGSNIMVNMSLSKGLEAYSNLPTIVHLHLPQFTDGPTHSSLCSVLHAIDHYFLADVVHECANAACECSILMNCLDKLDKMSQPYNTTYSCPFPQPGCNFLPSQFSNSITNHAPNDPSSHLSSEVSLATQRWYVEAVKAWYAKYDADTIPGPEMDNYPITPESASPGSGKCWCYGQKGHRWGMPDCQQFPVLPEAE